MVKLLLSVLLLLYAQLALGQPIGNGSGGGTTLTDSASLRAALSDETGTGVAVFATTPTLVTPVLGAATATSIQFTDSLINNDGANILAQRNGANPQILRIYNTDPTLPEWLELNWQAQANVAVIRTATTGGSGRPIEFRYGNTTLTGLKISTAVNGGVLLAYNSATTANTAGRIDVGNNGGNTSTTGISITERVRENFAPTATSTMDARLLELTPTINYSNGTPGAGSYTIIYGSAVETALPTGTNYLIRMLAGAAGTTEKFAVKNTGVIVTNGTTAISTTCTVIPTGMTVVNGLITAVVGGTCS